jgi:tetratricopeptide (TPR) repeat protein
MPSEEGVRYDFNVLEKAAQELIDSGRPQDAIKIYLFMGDGDQSLDAGYLGERLGECYEAIGDLHAAKYWYGRAVEENPTITPYVDARKRLESVTIDALVPPKKYVVPRRR